MSQKPGRESSPANPLAHLWRWGWGYLRNNWSEIAKFLTVGGANYVVDLAVFNLFLLWLTPQWPLFDKCVAVAVATTFSWIANRSWTFRERGGHGVAKEALLFVLVNVIGALPPLACLWVSHYLLSFTSPLADNISANIIGLIIGTALRYVLYKLVVFPTKTTKPN
ncbi:GtrA-like protein [Mobiluncus mulieris ATCC 35239]|uniref:GtrA-like protein n=2 Tax=Mobiluncus mulieris TaxID=2052 RepID=E0QSZ7_9ACTO|nr:GtrA family protein [Mobiluncus mulieris]EFM45336.1 GtrA-like protein [Mobiluncus mulieris ATCC 35239]MCU9994263.1 GtrA family protein [Mobiluncus mulieris]MCV0014014.1 GtrA family protein [Mobiluncus mulieris]NMW63245.1 GtrA family protein [Mobiluncus mulieris]NMW64949.1 GtrA family protein [Mobiluncus mulieris]